MKIRTRDFGEIEVGREEIITFCQPVFGFDGLSEYVFLYDREFNEHFVWLQSAEDENVCFILTDPATVVADYAPILPDSVEKMLGEEDCMCWLIMSIPEQFKDSTVNLKSPIVVNPTRKRAVQVILDEDLPIRYPLFGTGKEGQPC